MNEDQHKEIQELLREIFNNINSWLSFAEAKNAAIIALNVASVPFIWNLKKPDETNILINIICAGMLISTIIALFSFYPDKGTNNLDKGNHSAFYNLILYKKIAQYGKIQYLKAVFKQYAGSELQNWDIQKIEEDLADEITYNANIVVRKYKCFCYALIIEIVMLLLLVIMIFIA